jgi:hypothetical protein
MKGFRPPPETTVVAHWPWIAGSIAALGVLAWWLRRRLRAKPVAAAPATALDRLNELERAIAADPEAGRQITYALSTLLRRSVDEFGSDARDGLTDVDWIARVETDERVPLGVRSTAARILRASESVKYALSQPTRFAVDEMLRDARHALETLAAAPRPEPVSADAARAPADKEAA